jgi:hypothetical protein
MPTRAVVCIFAILVAVAAPAQAGRKQILKAFASAVYAISDELELAASSCTCIDAFCDRVSHVILACGAAGIAGANASQNVRLLAVQPATGEDGRAECNVCACNDSATDSLTLRAEGTCLAVPR